MKFRAESGQGHNSVNFQARSSRFYMVVHFFAKKQHGRQKQNGITELSITQSIFKLEAPTFPGSS